jgi:hypothetical protein
MTDTTQSKVTAEITFSDLLGQKKWDDYGSFISQAPEVYTRELGEDMQREEGIRKKIRETLLAGNYKVRRYDKGLENAGKLLFGGKVIGIDGTVAKQRTLAGLRAQIGIVAVNYFNEKIQKSYFISEAALATKTDEVIEILKSREARNRVISDMVIRALMLYREREVAMRPEFSGSYKLLHGPLLPFELMTGLGRLRALEATLDILERLVADPKVMSIVSSTTQDDYLTLGMALEPGEYLVDESFPLGEELKTNPDFFSENKWRTDEYGRVKAFLEDAGSKIWTGVIKVSQRPYVFHAHKSVFEEAASIIARDALLQREKGFPLLIDYADNLCSEYFPAGDFLSILSYRLAREGKFLAETGERQMRLK